MSKIEVDQQANDLSLISSRTVGGFPIYFYEKKVNWKNLFKLRLRKGGISVLKHGRIGEPKRKLLMWSEENPHFMYWCTDFGLVCDQIKIETIPPNAREINLQEIVEIRRGTEIDASNSSLCGTPILRRHCEPHLYGYCVSLIFASRTVDIQFLNKDDFNTIVTALISYLDENKSAEKADFNFSDMTGGKR